MRRIDQLEVAHRGLVNTVCRPDHLTHFQITGGMAAIAASQEGLTARQQAVWLFTALARVLEREGALDADDVTEYVAAAGQWAWEYELRPDRYSLTVHPQPSAV